MHLSFFHSCSDLEDVEEIFEKLKCGTFKILDFCLLFFLKSLNEVLSVWKELYKRGRPFLNSFQVLKLFVEPTKTFCDWEYTAIPYNAVRFLIFSKLFPISK